MKWNEVEKNPHKMFLCGRLSYQPVAGRFFDLMGNRVVRRVN